MAKQWTVYIARASYFPQYKAPYVVGLGESAAQWRKDRVMAETRREALLKVLDAMKSEQSKLAGKYVSVWVGHRSIPSLYPGRLQPFQIIIATWKVRDPDAERRARALERGGVAEL